MSTPRASPRTGSQAVYYAATSCGWREDLRSASRKLPSRSDQTRLGCKLAEADPSIPLGQVFGGQANPGEKGTGVLTVPMVARYAVGTAELNGA